MKPRDLVNGRFEIDRRAGHGGMGTVYRAIDRQTGAPVAVKVILGGTPDLAQRFSREAAVLAELRHPGIVRFVSSGETPEGEAYLAMEWLEGEDLDDRLARGPLSVPETLELGRRVAEALAVAHARGVIHRDLKPSNLFLVGGDIGRVTLLDFGIARLTADGQSLTRTGQTLGSPGYTSPEQARGERNLDARADVFSLACVLFKCLTGSPPFTGEMLEVLMKVVMDPAPLASSRRPDVPPALEGLLQRMFAKKPDARPADAAAVAAELAAVATTLRPDAVPPTNRYPSTPPIPERPQAPPIPERPQAARTALWNESAPPAPAPRRVESVPPAPPRPESAPPGPLRHDSAPPRSAASPFGSGPGAWLTAPFPLVPQEARAPAPGRAPPPTPLPPLPPARRSRAPLLILAAVGAMIVTAGVVLAALFAGDWMGSDERPAPPPPAKAAPPASSAKPKGR